jgi:molecular chaperone DnaK
MVRDAEAHAEEDKKRREEAEARNQAETLVYQTEKVLKENDEKLPEETKTKVKGAIDEVNEALKGEDVDAISSAVEKLATESQALGQALYADAGAAAAGDAGAGDAAGEAGAGSSSSAKDDDVVDAEIVDDEDEKKK